MDLGELEGIADHVLSETGCDDPPVDAIELADLLGLRVRWSRLAGARQLDDEIHVAPDARVGRIHGLICHEIAHVLLDRFRVPQSERAANYLGAALLVPRRILDRELRAGWDLHAMMEHHVNASAELLARRIVDLREARLAVYDNGRLRYRINSAQRREQALAAEALASAAPVRDDDLTGAWPIIDGQWKRVLVLSPP